MKNLAPGVKPLTASERTWVASLEEVLKKQPARLLLIECGDSISVVDRQAAKKVDLADGAAERNGVLLADVRHSCGKLTGVSG